VIKWVETKEWKISLRVEKILKAWFFAGPVSLLFGSLISVWTIGVSLKSIYLHSEENSSSSSPAAIPIIPGINFPVDRIVELITAISIGIFIHELGHFLCAVAYDIKIASVGVSASFWIPSAFVQMDIKHNVSQFKRLMAFSAGVWNNFVLFVLLKLLLHESVFSILMSPIYSCGNRLAISGLSSESVFHNIEHFPLEENSKCYLDSLNGERIYNHAQLKSKAYEHDKSLPRGFCFSKETWDNLKSLAETKCCRSLSGNGLSQEYSDCFRSLNGEYACSKIKNQVDLSSKRCIEESENCQICAESYWMNSSDLVSMISITCDHEEKIFHYLGSPNTLADEFKFSECSLHNYLLNFITSKSLLSILSAIPEKIQSFLDLTGTISLSIGLVNSAPILFFDGQHALTALLFCVFGPRVNLKFAKLFFQLFTLLFAFYIISILSQILV
jgi:hypothetical protein